MLVAVVWKIWKLRNKVVFNNGVVDDLEIFSLAQLNCWTWVKYCRKRVIFSLSDWNFCPLQCLINLG